MNFPLIISTDATSSNGIPNKKIGMNILKSNYVWPLPLKAALMQKTPFLFWLKNTYMAKKTPIF